VAFGRLFRTVPASFAGPVARRADLARRTLAEPAEALARAGALARVAFLRAPAPTRRADDARRVRFLARGWALAA